jgi:hypothetical protein
LYTEQLAASKATTKPEKANFVSYEKKIIITSFSRQHHHFSSANKLSLFVLSTRLIPCCKIRYKNMYNLKCILKLSFFRRLSHIFAVVLRDDLIYILPTYLFDLHLQNAVSWKERILQHFQHFYLLESVTAKEYNLMFIASRLRYCLY